MASGVSMVSFPLPQSSACARFHTAKSVSVMPLDSRMRWSCLSSAARFGASLAICPSALMYVTPNARLRARSEEHTSELQSLMRISYAVFCLKKKKTITNLRYSDSDTQLAQSHEDT